MKRLVLFILASVSAACSSINEFGNPRVKFNIIDRIKSNTDEQAYQLIDTSVVYQEISYTNKNREPVTFSAKRKQTYLKFYANGRVGEFRDIDINNVDTFNPKKARSGLYRLKDAKLMVQFYFTHVQCGQCFIKEELKKISSSTFELHNDGYISTYKTVALPLTYRVFKPDW